MPTARDYAATGVVKDKIYAIGGLTHGFVAVSAVEAYDPATDTWTKKANMPTARGTFTAEVNGKIYAIGGGVPRVNLQQNLLLSTVEIYFPETDTWTKGTNLPTAKDGFSTSVVNGVIYVIGGTDSWPNPNTLPLSYLSTVEAFDTGLAVSPQGKLPTLWGLLKVWERLTVRR